MGSEEKQQVYSSIEPKIREGWVIVSDLDGSLLDHHTYSPEAAKPALARLRRLNLPLVLNTSKTIKETLPIASSLGIGSPIIVENGGAIFLTNQDSVSHYWVKENTHLEVSEWIPYGITRNKILLLLKELKEKRNLKFTSFSEMSPAELSSCTGLTESSAKAAKNRDFSEPLIWEDTPERLDWFGSKLEKNNLNIVKGGVSTPSRENMIKVVVSNGSEIILKLQKILTSELSPWVMA
jgi:mannosyl-3-phosphoglycerate phosphatase